jgi:hypothetical protein
MGSIEHVHNALDREKKLKIDFQVEPELQIASEHN